MSITLSIAINDSRPDEITHFEWRRDNDGNGGWVTLSKLRGLSPNCYVHRDMEVILTAHAKSLGLSERHDFAHSSPRPNKAEKTSSNRDTKVSGGSGRKLRHKNPLLAAFNPFC